MQLKQFYNVFQHTKKWRIKLTNRDGSDLGKYIQHDVSIHIRNVVSLAFCIVNKKLYGPCILKLKSKLHDCKKIVNLALLLQIP